MKDEMDYDMITLPNGLRVVAKQVNTTSVAHCGITLDVGSRDESDHEQGLAHFWEHMAFKGTKKRKAYHIINRLESVGGELNAYTTKEKIIFYSTSLDKYLDRSLEILSDITFNSSFPERELIKEKGVVLEEIMMYQDSPEDAIFDDFDDVLFPNHPIGKNILGTSDLVKGFKQADFLTFINEKLDTSRVVISIVSSVPTKKVLGLVQKYFESIETKSTNYIRKAPPKSSIQHKTVFRPINQCHTVLGRDAFPIQSDQRIPFFVLNNILGGHSLSSRLNMQLREKNGLVYTVESNYISFSDTGFFAIYFATDQKNQKRAEDLIRKEITKLKNVPLGKLQLSSLKERICAQLAMAEENNAALMQMMGKSLLDLGYIESLSSVFDEVRAVKASQLQELANDFFDLDQFSQLTYLPENGNH